MAGRRKSKKRAQAKKVTEPKAEKIPDVVTAVAELSHLVQSTSNAAVPTFNNFISAKKEMFKISERNQLEEVKQEDLKQEITDLANDENVVVQSEENLDDKFQILTQTEEANSDTDSQEMETMQEPTDNARLMDTPIIKPEPIDQNYGYTGEFDGFNFPFSEDLKHSLKYTFELPGFRPTQLQAINAVMQGHSCLIVMASGAGKSLCYQMPAALYDGCTVVFSPLKSHIYEQVQYANEIGVSAAINIFREFL